MENKVSRHPSYGYIRAGRVSGDRYCFMSSVATGNYITIEIGEAELIQNADILKSYPTGNTIVKIRLTNHQFAELITNLHSMAGVPCTLERISGEKVVELPEASDYSTLFEDNLSEALNKIVASMDSIKDELDLLLSQKSIKKRDLIPLKSQVEFLETQLTQNIPYLEQASTKMLQNKISELKTEISAWMEHKLISSGLESLKEKIKL